MQSTPKNVVFQVGELVSGELCILDDTDMLEGVSGRLPADCYCEFSVHFVYFYFIFLSQMYSIFYVFILLLLEVIFLVFSFQIVFFFCSSGINPDVDFIGMYL